MNLEEYWQRELDQLRESLDKISNGETSALKLRQKILLFFLLHHGEVARKINSDEYRSSKPKNKSTLGKDIGLTSTGRPAKDMYYDPEMEKFARIIERIDYYRRLKYHGGPSPFKIYMLLTTTLFGIIFLFIFIFLIILYNT